MDTDLNRVVYFCSKCFADSDGGSWGEPAEYSNCYNCNTSSFGHGITSLPKYIVENIRKNASWVGKRYYAHEEDYRINEELKTLRDKVGIFPGRHVIKEGEHEYLVIQQLSLNSHQMMFVKAADEKDALERSKSSLPYMNLKDDVIEASFRLKAMYESVKR